MDEKKIIIHRKANRYESYETIDRRHYAEGDLVNIWHGLYMFHPGGIFTFFMVMPLFYLYWLTWRFWKKQAWPYQSLIDASNQHKIPIVLELKNIKAEEIPRLPRSIAHIDVYDLTLGLAVKRRFNCALSIHTLWANKNGCLLFKSNKGYFRWHTWAELDKVDIITVTYQLSSAWFHNNAEFWRTLKQNSGKTILLGGGFQSGPYKLLFAGKFNDCIEFVDGWYSR